MKTFSKQAIINNVFVQSWWVYVFCAICFLGYNHFVNKRKNDIQSLQERLADLDLQKNISFHLKEDLYQQICSQSDPAWIELVLMKQLGVVPDGYLKIHFKKE